MGGPIKDLRKLGAQTSLRGHPLAVILNLQWERKRRNSMPRLNARPRSFRAISRLSPLRKLRACARRFMRWQLSLPAPQGAEKGYDLRKTWVLVLYPVLPQNLHKLPLIPPVENPSEIASQSVRFGSGVFVLIRHRYRGFCPLESSSLLISSDPVIAPMFATHFSVVDQS